MRRPTCCIVLILLTVVVGVCEAQAYGAVARGTDGAGRSRYQIQANLASESEASQAALQACRNVGWSGCEIVRHFENTCNGAARSSDLSVIQIAFDDNPDRAAQTALSRCAAKNSTCSVVGTSCDKTPKQSAPAPAVAIQETYASAPPLARQVKGERVFIKLENTCFVDQNYSDKVRFSAKDTRFYYMETAGGIAPTSHKVCDDAGTFGILPGCRDVKIYSFITACSGGLVTAPSFYIAYFNLWNTERDYRVSNNQLSYLPSAGARSRNIFPLGYAPFDNIEKNMVRVPWDEERDIPKTVHSLGNDQVARTRALFQSQNGLLKPFPETNLQQANVIAQELPPAPPVPISVPRPGGEQRPVPGQMPNAVTIGLWVLGGLAFVIMFMLKSGLSTTWVLRRTVLPTQLN